LRYRRIQEHHTENTVLKGEHHVAADLRPVGAMGAAAGARRRPRTAAARVGRVDPRAQSGPPHARITPGAVLLDVGTGAGLIAFGAIEQVGPHGTFIFSDISQDLLDHCLAQAGERGVLDRCQFLRAAADNLAALADASVDVVTSRSVLIYVPAKQQAFVLALSTFLIQFGSQLTADPGRPKERVAPASDNGGISST
jgi:2-polyprenyl-3-methyl-5-hydroxy-6-metoxy-1,4-benzoquinol methylase